MIYLGADHGGFDMKEKIKSWLSSWGYAWEDLGNTLYNKEDDYPEYAFKVATQVVTEERNGKKFPTPWKDRPKGILLCRSAGGVVIAANKIPGARAIAVYDERAAVHARAHNDANIIALSGDWTEELEAEKILRKFLETEFTAEERHVRRLKQIEEYEKISG